MKKIINWCVENRRFITKILIVITALGALFFSNAAISSFKATRSTYYGITYFSYILTLIVAMGLEIYSNKKVVSTISATVLVIYNIWCSIFLLNILFNERPASSNINEVVSGIVSIIVVLVGLVILLGLLIIQIIDQFKEKNADKKKMIKEL